MPWPSTARLLNRRCIDDAAIPLLPARHGPATHIVELEVDIRGIESSFENLAIDFEEGGCEWFQPHASAEVPGHRAPSESHTKVVYLSEDRPAASLSRRLFGSISV